MSMDPYIRDQMIAFLAPYVQYDGGAFAPPEDTADLMIRQAMHLLVKERIFSFAEISHELRDFGLCLTADTLRQFVMSGMFRA